MKHWLSFTLMIFLCIPSEAMEKLERSSTTDNNIVHFNIGGLIISTTIKTVKMFGGNLLNNFLDDIKIANIDAKGFIFIDRDPQQGELLRSFMQGGVLPSNYDENIADAAAQFFDNQPMKQFLDEQKNNQAEKKSKWSYAKTVHANNKCKECDVYDCRTTAGTILHLINEHKGKIIQTFSKDIVDKNYVTRPYFEIIYRVPKK